MRCMFSCKRNIRSQGYIEKRRTKAKFCLIKLKYGTKKNKQSCNKKEGGLKYREEVNVSEKQSGLSPVWRCCMSLPLQTEKKSGK